MSVIKFAEDFSRLVVRYTKGPLPNNEHSEDAIIPLNYNEITKTVCEVLSTLGIKDCNDKKNSLMKTSNITIDIPPTPPIVSQINCKQNDDDDSRSDDILPAFTDFGLSASDTSTVDEKEVKIAINGLKNEKKFLSRSNPMICINDIGRSDTFVCDKKQVTSTDDAEAAFQENSKKNIETSYTISNNLLQLLNEVQTSSTIHHDNIIKKVERIKKQMFPQTRRLSLNSAFSGFNHNTSAMNKTNLSTKLLRRSINLSAGTPTSSRSLSVEREDSTNRRKTIGESKCGIITSGKLSISKKLGHSTSNLNLSQSNKLSDSIPKRTKNPKYAHVQSTIPKPTQMKKKPQ